MSGRPTQPLSLVQKALRLVLALGIVLSGLPATATAQQGVAPPRSGAVSSQEGKILTSALSLKWDKKNQIFRFYFSIQNNDSRVYEPNAIILLQAGKLKRWRGILLPEVEPGETKALSFELPAQLLLKDRFKEVELKLYTKGYTKLLDSSANYQRLKLDLNPAKTSMKVNDRLLEKAPPLEPLLPHKTEQTFPIGNKRLLDKLLKLKDPSRNKLVEVVEVDKKLQPLPPKAPAPAAAPEAEGQSPAKAQPSPEALPPLVAPQGLQAVGLVEEVRLSWQALPGADSYQVQWGTSPNQLGLEGQQTLSSVAQLTLAKLQGGQTYHFRVAGVRVGQVGPWSPVQEVRVAAKLLPPAAPSLLASRAGNAQVEITWQGVDKAQGYRLYWGTTPEEVTQKLNPIVVEKPGYLHRGLVNQSQYYYQVTAFNPAGESAPAGIIKAQPREPEATVSQLLDRVNLEDFQKLEPLPQLLYPIADQEAEQRATLQKAKELESLDLGDRDKMIALFVAEGKAESVAKALSGQLAKEPENLNLSLSLSKVYHKQGNISAALNVLTASLGRVSLSARVALNQNLKTQVSQGTTTLTQQSDEAFLAKEFFGLGQALLEQKKYADALSAFQSLKGLVEAYPMIDYYLGMARRGAGQFNQAKDHFLAQMGVKNAPPDQLKLLHAMTQTLPQALEIASINSTLQAFGQLKPKEAGEGAAQMIGQDVKSLQALLAKAEEERKAGLPDLALAILSESTKAELQPGQEIPLEIQVQNLGNKASQAFVVSYKLKAKSGLELEFKEQDQFPSIEGKGGKNPNKQWKRLLLIPDRALPGAYQLVASLEEVKGRGEVSLENNKATSKGELAVIEPRPDLELRLAKEVPSRPVAPGQSLQLAFGVNNRGFKTSGPYRVKYFLESRQGKILELTQSSEQLPLAPGAQGLVLEQEIKLPASLPYGQFRVKASLESMGKVKDDPANHLAFSAYRLRYLDPALRLGQVSLNLVRLFPQQDLEPSAQIEAQLLIKNTGEDAQEGLLLVAEAWDQNNHRLDWQPQAQPLEPLAAGEERSLTYPLQLPQQAKPGAFTLKFGLRPSAQEKAQFLAQSPKLTWATPAMAQKEAPGKAAPANSEAEESHPWWQHAAALSLGVGGAWLALEESQAQADAQAEGDAYQSATNQAASSVQLAQLQNSQAEQEQEASRHQVRTQLYALVAITGLVWEGALVFGDPQSSWDFHSWQAQAGLTSLALLSVAQAYQHQNAALDLDAENQNLLSQRQAATSTSEMNQLTQQIRANNLSIVTHTENRNLYGLVGLAAGLGELWAYWGQPSGQAGRGQIRNSLVEISLVPQVYKEQIRLLTLSATW